MRWLVVMAAIAGTASTYGGEPRVRLVEPVREIWKGGRHNAFTDLVRFKGGWICVFREGRGHASGAGKIRIIASKDGVAWRPLGLISLENVDLRDPHICVTPDGRLMINGGAAYPASRDPVKDHYSWVSFSKDGTHWTKPERVCKSWEWLWRVTWHGGRAWGVAYGWDPKSKRRTYRATLYKSSDGIAYDAVTRFSIPQTTEATIRFDGETMYVLQRRDGKPNSAMLGIASPPYTKFQWKDLGIYFGGPNFVKGPDGNWWAAGRIIKKGAKTVVCRLDVTRGKLEPVLELPSGGDTSYPGLVWHDRTLWISYYSSHQGRARIYLAKVRIDSQN